MSLDDAVACALEPAEELARQANEIGGPGTAIVSHELPGALVSVIDAWCRAKIQRLNCLGSKYLVERGSVTTERKGSSRTAVTCPWHCSNAGLHRTCWLLHERLHMESAEVESIRSRTMSTVACCGSATSGGR